MPSRRHRTFTVVSRLIPSKTMRIFSSRVYLRRVTARTWRTKLRVCGMGCSACSSTPLKELLTPPVYSVF